MSTDRAALLSKTHKILKKHYKPVAPHSSYSILEHLLFACCLEGAKYEAAEEGYAILQQKYFDWNEVRVTAIGELAEVLTAVPDSAAAAKRVRGVLQSMFEQHYTFDLEFLRKQNQGKTVNELAAHRRITPFVINYLVQCGLGGHSIPLNAGAFEVLYVLGVISEKDKQAGRAPGLERAVSKKHGIEFGSLLHQLAVDYLASRHSTRVRAILQEIAPDCKERLPKRGAKKVKPEVEKAAKLAAEESSKASKSKQDKKAAANKSATSSKAAGQKTAKKAAAKKATTKKAAKKSGAKKKTTTKKSGAKSTGKKKKTTSKKASRIKKPR